MKTQLSIIIVHYKTLELTLRCLESLDKNPIEGTEIIIVDNDSQDGAKDKVTSVYSRVKWITNDKNEGFGRANNLGVKNASGEYLLFLNSDMIVPEGTIQACLNYFKEHPKTGVLGPKLLNEDGTLQKSTYCYIGDHQELWKDNLLLDKIKTFTPPPTRAVMGSFFMCSKETFKTSGGFDPHFFMYCEELDLCERISALNKSIVYLEDVHATHKHGGSSEGSDWWLRQTLLSRALLVYKRRGLFHYMLSHWIYNFNFCTNFILMWGLDKRYRKDFWRVYRAYFRNWLRYWTIPFTFTRKIGTQKKLLRSA